MAKQKQSKEKMLESLDKDEGLYTLVNVKTGKRVYNGSGMSLRNAVVLGTSLMAETNIMRCDDNGAVTEEVVREIRFQ